MLWNLYSAGENSTAAISTFKGLDRKYKGSNGEWRDMWNMSSSGYPCLVPRKARTELYSGYANVRLVIPPINKNLDDDVPGFTGIADNAAGNSVLYYEGSAVKIDYDYDEDNRGTIPAGYEDSTNIKATVYQDPPRYVDKSVIFPKGEGTEITYAWANNRLFIFVSNTQDFGDLECLTTTKIDGNIITVKEDIDDATAAAILNRNIILYFYDYEGTTYNLKYYVTAVTAGSDGAATLTLNEDVCLNTYNESAWPATTSEFTVYPMHDSGKYYYDAGKTSSKLYNAEKGLYDEPMYITTEDYTDETLGLTYEDVCCLRTGSAYTGTKITFSDYFDVGDRVKLAGFRVEENNTVTVYSDFTEVEDGRCTAATVVGFHEDSDDNYTCMYIEMLDADGNNVKATSEGKNDADTVHTYNPFMSVSKIIPDMNSVIWHNQRMWGTNANGEYFYASAVSDPFTWFGGSYGTASAPVQYASGTQDEYVGLVDYGQYVILLKPTTIQQVYALASSSTVSIAKAQYNVGCIDIHSALVIGSTLYYLGYQGFYAYGGGEPELISSKLNTKYVSAWAVTDGIKYYVSAVTEDGETEFLVYDTQYSLWHKEDDMSVSGGYIWYDKPIVAVKNADGGITAYQLNTDGDEEVEWWAESILMFEGTMDNKAVNELWIRAYIPVGKSITLYTTTNHMSRDDDIWREHMTLKGMGDIKVYRVPIRAANSEYYRFKLAGTGQSVVYDIERKLNIDGRPYTR